VLFICLHTTSPEMYSSANCFVAIYLAPSTSKVTPPELAQKAEDIAAMMSLHQRMEAAKSSTSNVIHLSQLSQGQQSIRNIYTEATRTLNNESSKR